jgi:hypothetical protein
MTVARSRASTTRAEARARRSSTSMATSSVVR